MVSTASALEVAKYNSLFEDVPDLLVLSPWIQHRTQKITVRDKLHLLINTSHISLNRCTFSLNHYLKIMR